MCVSQPRVIDVFAANQPAAVVVMETAPRFYSCFYTGNYSHAKTA